MPLLHCDWGLAGLHAGADTADILIIVDVLSFSTAVDIACARGAGVVPATSDGDAEVFEAAYPSALMASATRDLERPSLSPSSLRTLSAGSTIILPSPNGATLARQPFDGLLLVGCLRNAWAIGDAVREHRGNILVIAAGERWPDGSLRVALEDWLGAGAIISHLGGSRTPEAQAAAESFQTSELYLRDRILATVSGQELVARGFALDVELAVDLDVSDVVPALADGVFRSLTPPGDPDAPPPARGLKPA
ncbi:MAG: 2-phosphosulfolactate phosphatase [bacterium]